MQNTSFISQGHKELLTLPLMHHVRGHSASLRMGIPVISLLMRQLARTYAPQGFAYDHLPSYHMNRGLKHGSSRHNSCQGSSRCVNEI